MLDAIFSRRSVREGFKEVPVPRDVLETIVSAGLAAPSSKAAQPWRMHVVTSRETLNDLADAVESAPGADAYVPIDPATGKNRPDWQSTVDISAEALRALPATIFIENVGRFSGGRHNIAVQPDPWVREDSLVGYGFEMIGHGFAIANMWLAAVELGLAGCFMGDILVAESVIRERLEMSGDLVGVVGFGYPPDGPLPVPPKFLEVDRTVWHD